MNDNVLLYSIRSIMGLMLVVVLAIGCRKEIPAHQSRSASASAEFAVNAEPLTPDQESSSADSVQDDLSLEHETLRNILESF